MRKYINKSEDLSTGLHGLIEIAAKDCDYEDLSNYCQR